MPTGSVRVEPAAAPAAELGPSRPPAVSVDDGSLSAARSRCPSSSQKLGISFMKRAAEPPRGPSPAFAAADDDGSISSEEDHPDDINRAPSIMV